MLGAGAFVGVAPASALAGSWLVFAIPIAALAATCCAFASIDQSAVYRGPGSIYGSVRSRVGLVPSRIASSAYLIGQAAAMAAVAGAIGDYAAPSSSAPVAAGAILVVVLAATAGVTIRGAGAWWSLVLTLVVLGVVVAVCFAIAPPPPSSIGPASSGLGITGAAGVFFFAYLGFERLSAPARESDRYSRRSIRRGTIIALVVATACYELVAVAMLHQLGSARLALSPTPAVDVLGAASAADLGPMIAAGVAAALLPVLLAVLESFRSTAVAVVRDGDLPPALGRVGGRGTPYLLDLGGGLVAAALAQLVEPSQAISIAACCLLAHYAFGNAGARLLLAEDRTWPMRLACLGMGLSVVLAMSMPVFAMLATLAAMVIGPVLMGVYSGRWS
jgi:APA family basic amino acid/polyamine antiporter